MSTSYHLTFHAVSPAQAVARMLTTHYELDLVQEQTGDQGPVWLCEGHVIADRLVVGSFNPEQPHDCPDRRHRSYLVASFTTGRVRDRGARRDYLLRLLGHLEGVTLVSQTFDDD